MFKISPIQSKEEQKECAAMTGAEFREGYFAYSMRDDETGELMGFSQFELSDGCGYISDLRSVPGKDDFEAMFILGRATMSFIDTCGAHISRAALSAGDETLMKAIGFKPQKGEYFADMTNFFNGSCHNK